VSAGLPMAEFPQTVGNLTESSTGLYELINGGNLAVYPDDEFRLAISRCVAIETSRGWRIAKEKQSHKIDVVVALAMAALGAQQQGCGGGGVVGRHAYATGYLCAGSTSPPGRTWLWTDDQQRR